MRIALLVLSLLGILFLLWLSVFKKPVDMSDDNYEGQIVQIKGIVSSQRELNEHNMLIIDGVEILSEFDGDFLGKEVIVVGRVYEDILIAEEITIL